MKCTEKLDEYGPSSRPLQLLKYMLQIIKDGTSCSLLEEGLGRLKQLSRSSIIKRVSFTRKISESESVVARDVYKFQLHMSDISMLCVDALNLLPALCIELCLLASYRLITTCYSENKSVLSNFCQVCKASPRVDLHLRLKPKRRNGTVSWNAAIFVSSLT
jgi:hypothetical protein